MFGSKGERTGEGSPRHLKDERWLPTLRTAAAAHPSAWVRVTAARGVAEFARAQAIAFLTRELDHRDLWICVRALETLNRLTGRSLVFDFRIPSERQRAIQAFAAARSSRPPEHSDPHLLAARIDVGALSNPLILFRKRGNSSWIVTLHGSYSATVPVPDPKEPMNEFDHEKLDVYVAAIDFVALADEVVERGRGAPATRAGVSG